MTFDEYKTKLIMEIKRLCGGDSLCNELLNETPCPLDGYVQGGMDNDLTPEEVAWAWALVQ